MRGQQRFKRRDSLVIETPGLDYGREIRVIAEAGNRMLLRVAGHKTWSGNYQPWQYYGTLYMAAIDQGNGHMHVIREEQPGRRWRPIVAEMKAWVEEAQGLAEAPPS